MSKSKKNLAVGDLLPWQDELPPFVAYGIARKKRPLLPGEKLRYTITEISERSGIPERTCCRISSKLSWRGVRPELASAFLWACEINPFKLESEKKFIRKMMTGKRKFPHLLPIQVKNLEVRCARAELGRAEK